MTTKLVVVDDGSTACKIAFFNTDNPETITKLISPNRAEIGRGISFGNANHVYTTNEELDTKYTFSDSKDALPTSNKEFQYGDLCRASLQHALVKSGIEESKIDLCVTLPINQFYSKDGSENQANIEKKKAAHLGYIRSDNHKTYEINSVSVYPEGIPAMLLMLEDSQILQTDISILIDIGGTTSDVCLFSGKLEELRSVNSYECGMIEIMDSIRSELNQTMTNIVPMHLDFILRNFDNKDVLNQQLHCDINVIKHSTPILDRLYHQLIQLNGGSFSNTKVYLTGGGALILNSFLKIKDVDSIVIPNPETALAEAILLINQG